MMPRLRRKRTSWMCRKLCLRQASVTKNGTRCFACTKRSKLSCKHLQVRMNVIIYVVCISTHVGCVGSLRKLIKKLEDHHGPHPTPDVFTAEQAQAEENQSVSEAESPGGVLMSQPSNRGVPIGKPKPKGARRRIGQLPDAKKKKTQHVSSSADAPTPKALAPSAQPTLSRSSSHTPTHGRPAARSPSPLRMIALI